MIIFAFFSERQMDKQTDRHSKLYVQARLEMCTNMSLFNFFFNTQWNWILCITIFDIKLKRGIVAAQFLATEKITE